MLQLLRGWCFSSLGTDNRLCGEQATKIKEILGPMHFRNLEGLETWRVETWRVSKKQARWIRRSWALLRGQTMVLLLRGWHGACSTGPAVMVSCTGSTSCPLPRHFRTQKSPGASLICWSFGRSRRGRWVWLAQRFPFCSLLLLCNTGGQLSYALIFQGHHRAANPLKSRGALSLQSLFQHKAVAERLFGD